MKPPLMTTPAADGYRMPAEWEPHRGTWMLWPERPDNWRAQALPAQRAFAAVAAAIEQCEPVTVGVNPHSIPRARIMLSSTVRIVELDSDDAWMRDVGPTCVVNDAGDVRGVDWQFNAWGGLTGGLYSPWDRDDAVAQAVCWSERIPVYRADFVLEGGGVHVDGEGTLLTTRQCLMNPNRNPSLTERDIEQRLRDMLGVRKILWLDQGVYHDETDGHIDNLACFVAPGEVLLTWTDDESDPQYAISRAAYTTLEQMTDAVGRSLRIHRIHQPHPMTLTATESSSISSYTGAMNRRPGDRLAASYINFYLANGGIIAPSFDDSFDEPAYRLLSRLFPDRTLFTVPSREILLGGGGIHCITQQIPLGVKLSR